jgi:hypothetical protein
MTQRNETGPAIVFWLWMAVTVGGLAVMFTIVIGAW